MYFFPTGINISTIFSQHYPKLVQFLPMADSEFQKQLIKSGICSSNVMENIKDRPNKAEKATYFLNQVIKPAVNCGNNKTFIDLLKILRDSSNAVHLTNIVQDIEAGM